MRPFYYKKNKIFIIIVGVLVILSLNFFQEEVKGFFYSISSSIQKNLWAKGIKTSNFWGTIFESQNLKRDNDDLKLKIQELLSEQNRLKELEDENIMLREALNLGLQKESKLELTKIISKDINRDSILIDKGSKDGISKGLFIITSQKVLIGTIAEVFKNYSRISLISDKESSFEAQISGSNASGLIKGLGRNKVFLDLIPKNEEIKEGDLVVSRGFSIGLIKEIKKIDASPFQQAEISPLLNVFNLTEAFIVLDF